MKIPFSSEKTNSYNRIFRFPILSDLSNWWSFHISKYFNFVLNSCVFQGLKSSYSALKLNKAQEALNFDYDIVILKSIKAK